MRRWTFLGFQRLLIFPTIAVWFAILAQATSELFFIRAAAGTYPLGLVEMLTIPRVPSELRFSPKLRANYVKGANYGTLAAILAAAPSLLLANIGVSIALILVSIGTMWLPSISELETFGLLLASDGPRDHSHQKCATNLTLAEASSLPSPYLLRN